MSRALRALTRSARLCHVGSSLSIRVRLGFLVVGVGIGIGSCGRARSGGGVVESGGGEGRGMNDGTRGLSGTSASRCIGAGEGFLGVLPLVCSTPTGV